MYDILQLFAVFMKFKNKVESKKHVYLKLTHIIMRYEKVIAFIIL